MPQVIPALVAFFTTAGPAIAGVSGAVGLGEGIANLVSGPPSAPQISTPPTVPTALPPRISPSTVEASNTATAADVQARGGGGLSPLFTQLLEQTGPGGVPYTG